jgi:hypothetical protein
MNTRQQHVAAVALGGAMALLGSSPPARVHEDWVDCEEEVARYCPKAAADDDAIYLCIEKREHLGDRAHLSDKCYAAYDRYLVKKQGVDHRGHD